MSLKKFLNCFSFVFLGVFALPTTAILISWNALPGDKLYPLKRRLEKIALSIVGDRFVQTEFVLRSKLIDRRFDETTTLLTRSSSLGLPELTAEIKSTKEEVIKQTQQAKQEKNQQIVKGEAVKLIAQLEKYDQELEEKKQVLYSQVNIQQSDQQPRLPSSLKTPSPTLQPTLTSPKQPSQQQQPKQQPQSTPYRPPVQPPPSTPGVDQETPGVNEQEKPPVQPQPPTVTAPQSPQNVAAQVDQTQQQIQQAIEELREATQEDKEKDKDKKDKEEKREDKQEDKRRNKNKNKDKD